MIGPLLRRSYGERTIISTGSDFDYDYDYDNDNDYDKDDTRNPEDAGEARHDTNE